MAGGFSVVITAVDKLTGTLDKINGKAAKFGAPFKRAQASLTKFGNVSGLNRVGAAFGNIAATARDAFGKVSQIVAPLGVISGAASVAGMYRMISAFSEWGSQLGFAAQNMNVTAGTLSNFQGAARLAGSSAGSLTSGFQTLGQTMFDAIGGRAPEAVVMMNTLGVAFRDVNGHARDVVAVSREVADKIKSMKDPFAQAKVMTELYGGAGAELLPFFRKGSAGFDELTAGTAKYNPVTQQSIDAANQFRGAQTRLSMSVEGLGNRISTTLAPIIAPLLTQLADWIATSPQVKSGIDALGQGVRQLADYLKGVDWGAVGRDILSWGRSIGSAIQWMGGLRTIVEVVAGVFAFKAAVGIASFGGSLLKLGLTVGRVGALFLPLLANPVGIAIAAAVLAVGGLAFAGYELWKHWDAVAKEFKPILDGIKAGFGEAWRFIQPIIDGLKGGIDFVAKSWLGKRVGFAVDAVGNAAAGAASSVVAATQQYGLGAVPAGQGIGGGGAARPSSAEQAKLAQQAVSAFVKFGWTPDQAAGIAAQAKQESGFNSQAIGDQGRALGAFQWRRDRQEAIEKHFGKSISQMSLQEQYAAKNWELRQGGEQRAGRLLAMTTTARDAGAAESIYDERPADRDGEARRRGGMADQIATRFASAVSAQGAALQVPNTATANGAADGTMTLRLEHGNQPPAGFQASVTKTSGSLAGAQVAQANVTATLP